MEKFVNEAIKHLRDKTDEEIMSIYAKQLIGHPHVGIVDAIGFIMEERKIEPGSMIIAFNYKDSTGSKKILQLMEV